jgi:hypothetical protein
VREGRGEHNISILEVSVTGPIRPSVKDNLKVTALKWLELLASNTF